MTVLVSMTFKRIAVIITVSCLTIFTWELVALKHPSQFKPSVGITFLANQSYRAFSWLGRSFAWLSSYLTIVELQDLYRAAEDLLRPICNLFASPLAFVKGYLEFATTYKYPIIIGLGSSILLAVSVYAVSVYAVPHIRSWWRRRRGVHVNRDLGNTTKESEPESNHSDGEPHRRRPSSTA
jgi:hypothetical protein